MTTPAVTISARREEGFWCCGVKHEATPRTWPAGHWSEEQLLELREQAYLNVAETDGAPAPDPGLPSTPTVAAALEQALSALRRATPAQIRDFIRGLADDPEVSARIDAAIDIAAHLIIAIGELEPGNPDHFTKDGKPRTDALEAVLGDAAEVSASDRDAAWVGFQEAKAKEDGK